MKTYIYRGFNRDGERRKGAIEAHDLKDAREKLGHGGIFPEQIEAATDAPSRASWFPRHARSLNHIAVRSEFYRALSALLNAGLPMGVAFEVLLEQPGGGQGAMVSEMAGIRDQIRDGTTFAQSFVQARVALTSFELAVIESGEKTGRLAEVLEQVADYLDDAGKIQQSLKTAAIYPAVVVALALVVGVGVMGFLVPQLATVFEESGMTLPALTRWVVGIGRWFLPVILPLMILIAAGLVFGMRRYLAQTSARISVERLASRAPFFRTGFQLLVTVRFARTCAMLLRGGVTMVETIALAGRATGSVWLAGILEDKSKAVRHGASFSQALAEVPVLGPSLSSWVKAGEAAGDIPGLFGHAAQRYQQLWNQFMQRTITIIEPALIIVVAVFVLLVALAILLPILSLNQQLS